MEKGKQIQLISIDSVWDNIEYKIIDQLYEYNCLDTLNKDSKILAGKILMTHCLKSITTTAVDFETTRNRLFSPIDSNKYPFVIFYFDESKVNPLKEILEYHPFESFIIFYKEILRDIQKVLNFRLIYCEFPYTVINNLNMGIVTKTSSENELKTEILLQFHQKKKLPMKTIKMVASKYCVDLTNLQRRKVLS